MFECLSGIGDGSYDYLIKLSKHEDLFAAGWGLWYQSSNMNAGWGWGSYDFDNNRKDYLDYTTLIGKKMYKYDDGSGDGTSILDIDMIKDATKGFIVEYWKYGYGYYFTRDSGEGWGNGTGDFAYENGDGEGYGYNEYPYTLITAKEFV